MTDMTRDELILQDIESGSRFICDKRSKPRYLLEGKEVSKQEFWDKYWETFLEDHKDTILKWNQFQEIEAELEELKVGNHQTAKIIERYTR